MGQNVTQERVNEVEGRYDASYQTWLAAYDALIAAQKTTEAAAEVYADALAQQVAAGAAMQNAHEAHIVAARERRELHEAIRKPAQPAGRFDAILRRVA